MAEVQKNAEIKIRLSKEEKEQFFEVCKGKAVNPSELIRQFIASYTKENKKDHQ